MTVFFVLILLVLFIGSLSFLTDFVEMALAYLVPLSRQEKDVLQEKCKYYQNLSPSKKLSFERRIKYFLMHKKFIGKQSMKISNEVRVLVAASFVQLTFGLRPSRLKHFKTIIIYPNRYRSSTTKREHIGEVNTKGCIIFSWEDFMQGFSIPDDAKNVGLHEMTHAIKYADIIYNDDEGHYFDYNNLINFLKIAKIEIQKIRSNENVFLRKYAGVNVDELFAVSIEYFFEKPVEFQKQLPKLYKALSILLNQDPARVSLNKKKAKSLSY